MKFRNCCAVLLGALLLPAVASAAGAAMKDGLWEISTTMEMPGMPFQPAPVTTTHCYTKEDLKDEKRVIPNQEGDCSVTDLNHSGTKVTWKVICTGGNKGRGQGEIVYRGDTSYEGSMKFEMEGMQMTSRYKGKRIGACK